MDNLRHKLRTVIFMRFRPGANKHAAKGAGNQHELIYSYRSFYALLDVVRTFWEWIQLSAFRLSSPTELTVEIIICFLEYKATSCVQTTVDWYRSMLASLGNYIRVYYKLREFDLHVPRVKAYQKTSGLRGAAAMMPREEYDRIRVYCMAHPSGSAYAVLMENYLGGRVTDVCERMCIVQTKIRMKCKGGKLLFRQITPELEELLNNPRFAAWRTENGRFSLPKSNSVNQFLRKLELRLGLPHHSFHDIRRLLAQEYYDGLRKQGIEQKQALSLTGLWLNHGPNRQKLVLKSYVKNP